MVTPNLVIVISILLLFMNKRQATENGMILQNKKLSYHFQAKEKINPNASLQREARLW